MTHNQEEQWIVEITVVHIELEISNVIIQLSGLMNIASIRCETYDDRRDEAASSTFQ